MVRQKEKKERKHQILDYIQKGFHFRTKKKEIFRPEQLAGMIQILIVNLESGLTLDRALKNTLDKDILINDIPAHESFHKYVLQKNNKEFFRLDRLVNQYQKNGSSSTIGALEKFHDELCIMQMSNIKKKAEETSVKLTLLLMLSLISIIMVVMTPVVLMLQNLM